MVHAQGRNRDLLSLTSQLIDQASNISLRLPPRIPPEPVHPFGSSKGSCGDHRAEDSNDCVACVSDPACGYCVDQNLCLEGTAAGPVFGECARAMDARAKPNWLHVAGGAAAAPYPTVRGEGPPIPVAGGDKNDTLKLARLVCGGGNDGDNREEDVPHFIAPIDERLGFDEPLRNVSTQLHLTWTADLHGLDCQRRLLEWISRRDDQGKPWAYAETPQANALTAEWFQTRYEDGDELPVECRDASIMSEVVRRHAAAIPLDSTHAQLRHAADWLVMRVPADTFVEVAEAGAHAAGSYQGEKHNRRGEGSDIMRAVAPFHSQLAEGEKTRAMFRVGMVVTFYVPASYLLSQIGLQQSMLMMRLQRSVGNKPRPWVLPR